MNKREMKNFSENQIGTIDPLMTTKDVARILQCSTKTVFRLVRARELPAVKLGSRDFRYRTIDIADYIAKKARGLL